MCAYFFYGLLTFFRLFEKCLAALSDSDGTGWRLARAQALVGPPCRRLQVAAGLHYVSGFQ